MTLNFADKKTWATILTLIAAALGGGYVAGGQGGIDGSDSYGEGYKQAVDDIAEKTRECQTVRIAGTAEQFELRRADCPV